MFKRFSHRVAALGAAAVITLSVLFALDQLATPACGGRAGALGTGVAAAARLTCAP